MKVANTVELRNHASRILCEVIGGTAVIVTRRGKPAAAITRLSEDDLEGFVLENSPRIRKMAREAEASRKRGETVSLDTCLRTLEG